MAEGTSLLRMHTAYTCIVSSNLTVSAIDKYQAISADNENRFSHRGNGFFSS